MAQPKLDVVAIANAIYESSDVAQIQQLIEQLSSQLVYAAFAAQNYEFTTFRLIHKLYSGLGALQMNPSIENRRALYGRVMQISPDFAPGGEPSRNWVRRVYGIFQEQRPLTVQDLDQLKQMHDAEAPEKQKKERKPEIKIIRRIHKIKKKPPPVIVKKVIRNVIKKKRAAIVQSTVAETLRGLPTTQIRSVSVVEAAREAHKAATDLVAVLRSGGDPTAAFAAFNASSERLVSLLAEGREGMEPLLKNVKQAQADALAVLQAADPMRDAGERMAGIARGLDKVVRDVVLGQLTQLGVANTVSSELRLMTTKVEALQREVDSAQIDPGKLDGLGKLVWGDIKELFAIARKIGKEAQAQTDFLIQTGVTLPDEHGLINAANQTADAAQMFMLMLHASEKGDPDTRFKVQAACGQMRQGLVNVVVNLRSKGGSGEISRRIEALAQNVYERLSKYGSAAEAANEATVVKKTEIPETQMKLNVARRNAAQEVDKRRRELEACEEEVKRLNRAAARRK